VRAAAGPDDPAGRRGMERFLAAERPDYLIVYPRWYPEIAGDRTWFRPLVAFDVPNNITLAGERLTVHITPWTRHPPRPPESP